MGMKMLVDLDFNGQARPIALLNPVNPQDAATKAYVDSAIEGLKWKAVCRVATQANISIASPGASIDGITMAVNDRVLVRAQTAAAENGIYVWNGATVAMTRSLDANTSVELHQAVTTVNEGTSAGSTFRQTSVNFVLGTGAVNWVVFGTAAPAATETTAGVAEIATQVETNAGTVDNVIVTPLKLANWSGRIRKFAVNIGDGAATSYSIMHNLNTQDVTVAIYRNSGAFDMILATVEYTTVNSVTVRFAAAPSLNQFRVVVVG